MNEKTIGPLVEAENVTAIQVERLKPLQEKRSQYIDTRKATLIADIKNEQNVLYQLISKSDFYRSTITSAESKEYYLDRCAELIANYEFGVIQTTHQMQRVPVNPETPWRVVDVDSMLTQIFYDWDESQPLGYQRSKKGVDSAGKSMSLLQNSIRLNLAEISAFAADEFYARYKEIGGAAKPLKDFDVAFFAGVEETAHWFFTDFKTSKAVDRWDYPIPDPQFPTEKYYLSQSAEFRALFWKAYFEAKLGVEYGFKERLIEARKLIRDYEAQNGIRARRSV